MLVSHSGRRESNNMQGSCQKEDAVALLRALQSATQQPPRNQLQTRSQDDEVSIFAYVLPRR